MLLEQFSQQLRQLAPNQTHFLIGFSGGLDSTALLVLFAKLRENQPHFIGGEIPFATNAVVLKPNS